MSQSAATDAEIAREFRTWLDLAEDAPLNEIWAARPSRVAVHRRLKAEYDPIEFIEVLLNSATDEHSLALICETIADLVDEKRPETTHAVFARSDDELWSLLSRYMFGPDIPDSRINLAQAAEAFVWLGGERDADEKHDDRYFWPAWELVHSRLDVSDPLPVLRYLVEVAQDEAELWHVLIGPFETVGYDRPQLREAMALMPGVPAEFGELIRTLGDSVGGKRKRERWSR